MPELGEIRTVRYGKMTNKEIWSACCDCGKQRWVRTKKDKEVVYTRCLSCSKKGVLSPFYGNTAEKCPCWKGGRISASRGYIQVRVYPDDFFYPMAQASGYVPEHRLIVAKALGRNLHPWELVHHKHDKYPAGSIEDKQDNRYPENLQLVSDLGHKTLTLFEMKIDKQSKQIQELKQMIIDQTKLIKLLHWKLKDEKVI